MRRWSVLLIAMGIAASVAGANMFGRTGRTQPLVVNPCLQAEDQARHKTGVHIAVEDELALAFNLNPEALKSYLAGTQYAKILKRWWPGFVYPGLARMKVGTAAEDLKIELLYTADILHTENIRNGEHVVFAHEDENGERVQTSCFPFFDLREYRSVALSRSQVSKRDTSAWTLELTSEYARDGQILPNPFQPAGIQTRHFRKTCSSYWPKSLASENVAPEEFWHELFGYRGPIEVCISI